MFQPTVLLQQQTILPICYLASNAWSTVRPPAIRTLSRKNDSQSTVELRRDDKKSGNTSSNTAHEKFDDLADLLKVKISPKFLTSVCRSLPELSTPTSSEWRASHRSADTFFENRNGFSKSLLQSRPCNIQGNMNRLANKLCQHVSYLNLRGPQNLERNIFHPMKQNSFQVHQQTRSFKTKHSTRIGIIRPEDSQDDKEAQDHKKEQNTDKPSKKLQEMDFFRRYLPLGILAILIWYTAVSVARGKGPLSVLGGQDFEVSMENPEVLFTDVRGQDEALEELKDIVMFLKDPERFTEMGAKLPKGVLLVGPPGVGKTLIAKAIAGEAGVPFFYASGSQFDEVFVGVGASRVRNIFLKAKQKAPAVIFIDEIDSLAGTRVSSGLTPHANQTINQLLSEMDGFSSSDRVIVFGATNMVDHLDSAVRRPGRFDTQVDIGHPDLEGRKEIIELYVKKIKYSSDTDIERLSKLTTGMTGADLANLVNQAALRAAVEGAQDVNQSHFDAALDRIRMGMAMTKRVKVMSLEEKLLTAHHEAGHALVGYFSKSVDKVHKLTILPRASGSLGHTAFYNEKDIYSINKEQLLARLDTAFGGRAAEELLVGTEKVTTGASSDTVMATNIAKAMVILYGMSEKAGLRSVAKDDKVSPEQLRVIDEEIHRLLQESYKRAKDTLSTHYKKQKALAEALVEHETLTYEEMVHILEGKKLPIPRSSP